MWAYCTPSLLACLRIVRGVALWMLTVGAAATVASALHRGPDPALLRAACASRKTADLGRRSLSMTSIPRGAQIVRDIDQAGDAEAMAWRDTSAVCP